MTTLTPNETAVLRVASNIHLYDCTAATMAKKLYWTTAKVSGVLKSLTRKGIVEAFETAGRERRYDVTPYGRKFA